MASLPVRLGSRGEVMRGLRRPGEAPGHCRLIAIRRALSPVFIAVPGALVNPERANLRQHGVMALT